MHIHHGSMCPASRCPIMTYSTADTEWSRQCKQTHYQQSCVPLRVCWRHTTCAQASLQLKSAQTVANTSQHLQQPIMAPKILMAAKSITIPSFHPLVSRCGMQHTPCHRSCCKLTVTWKMMYARPVSFQDFSGAASGYVSDLVHSGLPAEGNLIWLQTVINLELTCPHHCCHS